MTAQIRVRGVVVQPGGELQFFEHRLGAARVVAGLRHHTEADAVGLALHVARKGELALHRVGLAAHQHRVAGVTIAGLHGGEHADHHGRDHERHLLGIARHDACDVALRDVRQLVAEHGRKLVPAADDGDQPEVEPEVTARQRKGVDGAVAAQKDLPGKALVELGRELATHPCCGQQTLPDVLHVFDDDRVVDVVGVAVDLARDLVAESALGTGRHLAAISHAGQQLRARNRRHQGLRRYQNGGA